MKKLLFTVLVVGSAAAPLLSQGAETEKAKAKTEEKASSLGAHDKSFVTDAAIGGMAEVELGKLAQEKGSSASVKEFGSMMVSEHTKANEDLKSLAQSKGIDLPKNLDQTHRAKMEKLSKLSGPEFDKAYMAEMLRDHKKDVSEFEKASKDVKDPEVKAFASRTLPTLQKHLGRIEELSR